MYGTSTFRKISAHKGQNRHRHTLVPNGFRTQDLSIRVAGDCAPWNAQSPLPIIVTTVYFFNGNTYCFPYLVSFFLQRNVLFVEAFLILDLEKILKDQFMPRI
jgi:hypothetical protein